jgi:hypothetical protein
MSCVHGKTTLIPSENQHSCRKLHLCSIIYCLKGDIDPVVTHFYDAVLLYANVVTSMSKRNLDYTSGLAFTTAVANSSFMSPASGRVTFNMDSDRLLDYELKALNDRTGKHDVRQIREAFNFSKCFGKKN